MTSSDSPTTSPASPAVSPPPVRDFGDEAARAALAALTGPYLPWGPGAMRPSGLLAVCNDIVLNRRRHVVELGSGVSTILLARLLTQQHPDGGFRLAAVEHDLYWAGWVSGQLDREGLGREVTVVHAPLAEHAAAQPGLQWYDAEALDRGLDEALSGEPVDLLLVDGPPAWQDGHELARYPALPALRHRLAEGASVILDDIERPGEQEILRRWEHETGLRFGRLAERAGVAMAGVGAGPR